MTMKTPTIAPMKFTEGSARNRTGNQPSVTLPVPFAHVETIIVSLINQYALLDEQLALAVSNASTGKPSRVKHYDRKLQALRAELEIIFDTLSSVVSNVQALNGKPDSIELSRAIDVLSYIKNS